MIAKAVVAILALAVATTGDGHGYGHMVAPAPVACEGAGVDPWVTGLRDRFLRFDELAHFAIEAYGSPPLCEGSVTTEFEGSKFGMVLLTFDGGATLTVETMPPRVSRVILRDPDGFADAEAVRAALVSYAAGTGLNVDWDAPRASTEGGERVESYWDPEPGLNASAALVFSEDVLVAVRLSLAP